MNNYITVSFEHCDDLPLAHQMASFYQSVHLFLADQKAQLGVTFPEMETQSAFRLGTKMRLHGESVTLASFVASSFLSRVRSPYTLSGIQDAPVGAVHRTIGRFQPKSTIQMRKRAMSRHNLTAEEAAARIPQESAQRSAKPFLDIHSFSTKQSFKLFFNIGEPKELPVEGQFNTYGLSNTATLPWF